MKRLLLVLLLAATGMPSAQANTRLLFLTHAGLYKHTSLGPAEKAVIELGKSGGFDVTTVEGFKRDFLPLFAQGKLKPLVNRVYDFADLPKAKDAMEADAHVGKIVVRIG